MDLVFTSGRSMADDGERVTMTGQHLDIGSDRSCSTPSIPRAAQTQIGRRLRAELDGAVATDLPDDMLRLLSELEARLRQG